MLFGKYCLLERVSVGGMAEVFRAKPFHAPDVSQYLALKRILPHLAEDDEFITMFVDEAKLTVQLRHPNIVQIYELGQFQSSYYILMEYIAGQDVLGLQKRLRQRQTIMSVAQACYIVKELAHGMDYAHRKDDVRGQPLNIIHRDISPQNVLVSYSGDVKVIDFGIAKAAIQNTHTQVGVLKGKFGYMSPEQVRGEKIDHRSDIFAIGTLFWELLTNRRLFRGETEFDTLRMVRDPEIAPPSTKNPQVPPQVERVVMKALAVDRNERYQWASEFAHDLEVVLQGANPPYERRHLAHWMENFFPEEYGTETEKHAKFRLIRDPDDVRRMSASIREVEHAEAGAAPEDATQIWDADVAPEAGEDIEAFAANHTVVQAGGFDLSLYALDSDAVGLAEDSVDEDITELAMHELEFAEIVAYEDEDIEPARLSTGDFAHQGTQPRAENPFASSLRTGLGVDQLGGTNPGLVAATPKKRSQLMLAAAAVLVFVVLLSTVLYVVVWRSPTPNPVPDVSTVVVNVVPPTNLEILFGGVQRGDTSPVTIADVIPGLHLVEVRHPDFKTHQESVRVERDGRVMPVNITLEPPDTGTLKLSWPGAARVKLYVDGERSPVEGKAQDVVVPPGQRLVEVLAPDYRVWSEYVDVAPGESMDVYIDLQPAGLTLEIETQPGSTVSVNGKSLGHAPVTANGLDPTKLHTVTAGRWTTAVGFPELGGGELSLNLRSRAQRVPESRYGWLTASTGSDWWRVYVDGVDTTLVTPISQNDKIPVLEGERTISFRRGRQVKDIKVTIRAGETFVVRENLSFE